MEEKDVEVLLSGNSITSRGKKEEKEEKDKSFYHMERSYGSSSDRPAARGIDVNKARRRFQERVLTSSSPDGRVKNKKQKGPIKSGRSNQKAVEQRPFSLPCCLRLRISPSR